MYNRDIKMLAHLNKMDQTFKQISFAFLSDRTLDDFHNRIRFDLYEFKEFYAQTLIDVLTVKAYLEADGKESYIKPIKADIQLLHTFANQCFKWIDAVEQLMNIENDVLKKNNWKLPLSKSDLITVDKKATTPFSFVEHYAHLSYLDKEKAVFFHLAMDNGIILNKLKQAKTSHCRVS
ncbi:hypothetical protein IAX14_000714 [Vibrio parahaemolyticus]|nr:hypothetical protein [Vibrio parahaemolyticus]